MKKNVSDETLEKIICDKLFFGLKTEEVAKKHDLSKSFVSAAVAAYKDVEAGNWEHIKFMLDGAQVNVKVVEWAASRIGVEVPASIYEPKEDKSKHLCDTCGNWRGDYDGLGYADEANLHNDCPYCGNCEALYDGRVKRDLFRKSQDATECHVYSCKGYCERKRTETQSKPKQEPKQEEQLAGQTTFPGFNEIQLQFSKGSNNTLHALIDALNRNADESAQLRKAIFGLLHSAGCVE